MPAAKKPTAKAPAAKKVASSTKKAAAKPAASKKAASPKKAPAKKAAPKTAAKKATAAKSSKKEAPKSRKKTILPAPKQTKELLTRTVEGRADGRRETGTGWKRKMEQEHGKTVAVKPRKKRTKK